MLLIRQAVGEEDPNRLVFDPSFDPLTKDFIDAGARKLYTLVSESLFHARNIISSLKGFFS